MVMEVLGGAVGGGVWPESRVEQGHWLIGERSLHALLTPCWSN